MSATFVISKWLHSSSRIKNITESLRPRLTIPSMFKMSTWDVKEHTIRKIPGVVAVLLSSKCDRLGGDVLRRLVVYVATYAKKPQVKKELCRVLDNVK